MPEKKIVYITTSTGDALRVTKTGIEIRDRDDKREWIPISTMDESYLVLKFLNEQWLSLRRRDAEASDE